MLYIKTFLKKELLILSIFQLLIYLLCAYLVPETILGAVATRVNEMWSSPSQGSWSNRRAWDE